MKIFSKVSHFGKKVGNERLSTRVGRISQNVRSLGKEPRFQEPVTKKPKMTGAEFHDMKKQQTKRKKNKQRRNQLPPKKSQKQNRNGHVLRNNCFTKKVFSNRIGKLLNYHHKHIQYLF